MTKEQIDECAKKMINKAGASLVSAKGQDNLQLYYGYGEKIRRSDTVSKRKIKYQSAVPCKWRENNMYSRFSNGTVG